MATKVEPMECESEMEESLRLHGFNSGNVLKSIDLTDDQKVMQIPSPDEPFITGIFHRTSDHLVKQYGMARSLSDVSAIQQAHFYNRSLVKSSPVRELVDEEYPTYTIARSEMELNSRALPKKYKCKFCVYKTSYKSDLNRHLRRHAKKGNIYSCDICNMPFQSINKMFSHKEQAHMPENDDLNLVCSLCSFRCAEKDIELFQLHVHQHIENNTCDVCNKSFNNPDAVEKHKKIFHQVPNEVVFPPQAQRPALSFSDRSLSVSKQGQVTTAQNQDQNQNGIPINNSNLNNTSSSNPNLYENSRRADETELTNTKTSAQHVDDAKSDLNSHQDKGPGNNLSDKSLTQHCKSLSGITDVVGTPPNIPEEEKVQQETTTSKHVAGVKKFKCENCGEVFPNMKNLFVHMSVCLQVEQNKKTGNYCCSLCEFQTDAMDSFYSHMIKHTFDKYSCDICNRPFSHYRNVLYHKRKIHCIDLRKRRSPMKLKAVSVADNTTGSKVQGHSDSSPYSTERTVQIQELADREIKSQSETQLPTDENNSKARKVNIVSNSSGQQTPTSGRYTRLVSDFDDFVKQPFACSLCFFRTGDANKLISHVRNHISGCYNGQLPSTIRFDFTYLPTSKSKIISNEKVYKINLPSIPVVTDIQHEGNLLEAGLISSMEREDYEKQIKYLENLLTNTRKRQYRFVSRRKKSKMANKVTSCDICLKEFGIPILAKRHMLKIHNVVGK